MRFLATENVDVRINQSFGYKILAGQPVITEQVRQGEVFMPLFIYLSPQAGKVKIYTW